MAAPVVVQATTATTGDVSSAVATPALTGIANGNLLVLVVAGWESGNDGFPNSVTDSMGNGWNLVASSQGPANGFTLQTYWTRAKTGGSNTVSVAMASGATGNASCCLMEISGADASSPIDQVLLATATSTTPSVGPTGATSQADELAIAAFTCADTNSGWSNPPTSYTSQAQITSKVYLNVSTQGLSSTGTQTVSYGTLASSTQWTALIVTLKAYIAPTTDDLVAVTSTTTGTGTYTLGSAVSGFQGTGGLTNGTVYGYAADDGAGGYEVGTGTYTSAGTTLSRGAIICSSNSNNAVSWAAGTRTIRITALAQQLRPTLTIFTGNGTWTPLATSKFFIAQAYGAGGAGGGGDTGSTGTSTGGGGGGGGGYQIIRGRIIDISTPVTITVAGASTGGAGGTGTGASNGAQGGSSSFGTYAVGYGGGGGGGGTTSGTSGGGGGGAGYRGAGGTAALNAAGAAGAGGGVAGPAGGTSPAGTISSTVFGGSSGAGGGTGATGGASNGAFGGGGGGGGGGAASQNGGAAGALNWVALKAGGAGAPVSGNGSTGNAGSSTNTANGQGGSGGGGGNSGTGGNGGAGGTPGGGGGGGGSGTTAPSGTGGAGGRGEVRVWEF